MDPLNPLSPPQMPTMSGMEPPAPAPVVPPEDQRFYNAAIRMAVKQAEKDAKISKYFIELFKFGEFKYEGHASANFTFSDVSILLSVLLSRDPNIIITPQSTGDLLSFDMLVQAGLFMNRAEAQEKYAKVLETIQKYNWQDTKTYEHIESSLFNTIVTGLGYVKIGFDEIKQTSRIDSLNRHEVFVDPAARHSLNQAQYVIQTCFKPIEEAKQFFAKIGYQGELVANYKLSDGEGLDGTMAKLNEPNDVDYQYYRFYEIWVKKADGSRVVYYRDYDKEGSGSWLHSRPWPYMLDAYEFPYAALKFSRQFQQFQDSFTDLIAVNGLRSAYERTVLFFSQHVFKTMASKIVYDKSAFGDGDIGHLLDNEDVKCIPAILSGRRIEDVIQKVTFTDGADVIIDLAASLKAIKDEITGVSDVTRGMAGKKLTAKQVGVQDDWSRTRIDLKQNKLDEFLIEILHKRLQIDLLLMPEERVARIAGQDAAMLWSSFDGDMEELKCLYSITVEAGSTGADRKEKRQQTAERMFKLLQEVNMTQPMPAFDSVGYALEIMKLEDWPAHPERFILGPVMPKDAGLPAGPGDPNNPNDQGAHGSGPGGRPPMPTPPGNGEPGSPM